MRSASSLLVCATLLLLFVPQAPAQDLPGGGPTPLLYLHPLVNYREDPEWVRAWERSLQSANSLRVNVGSVSTDDFLTDVELHLTEPIAYRFRVLYDLRWFEALHVETRDAQHFLGFEFGLLPSLGLQGQINPTSRKEEVDLLFGVLIHTPDRDQFARVMVRWDDPLFDEKNGVDAVGEQTATSLEWTVRGVLGPVELFSRGLYGSATERSYPDSVQVPEPFSESGRLNGSETRVRLIADRGRFAEFEIAYHDFEAGRVRRADGGVERYDNRLLDLALRGVWRFDNRWRARAALHRLDQQAFVDSKDYSREEWMPAVWLRWSAARIHAVEVGYMGTSYDWTGSPDIPESESGYKQKLELAWLIEPSENARLQFSLSHEPDPQRFGGANVQVQVGF